MKGFTVDLEKATIENDMFRKVLYTAPGCQLVLMALAPGQDIGEEVHELDQFIRVEAGEGKAVLGGVEHPLRDGSAVVVPRGLTHNVVNTGAEPLKLYTVYAPPEHRDGVAFASRLEAEAAHEHFDGQTTEGI